MLPITKINELLTKTFQRECYLVDDSNLYYKLKFPSTSSVTEFEKFSEDCRKFLSQYDIETGSTAILYEPNKTYVLQIKKLPLEKFLEKLNALENDLNLHEACHEACQIGSISELKMLLDQGANGNAKNISGETLLHIASRENRGMIIIFLLRRGVLVNVPNYIGETPLQIVDQKNETSLGKMLIGALLKQDPNTERPDFKTQELSNYWDKQLKELADGATTQVFEEADSELRMTLLQQATSAFFFSKVQVPLFKQQVEKPSTLANSGN